MRTFRQTSCRAGRCYRFIYYFSMTSCSYYRLCYENFTTYGAMRTFRQTSCRAGRCYRFIYYFSMTSCSYYRLCYENFTTYGAMRTFRQTSCRAGRCYRFIYYFSMTSCSYYRLCYENFTTYGAMRTFRQTSCRAGRCYCCVYYFGMTKCVYRNRVTAQFRVTYRTVYYVIIRSIIYAIRRYVVFYNYFACGMTKRRDFAIRRVITTATRYVCVPTDFRTGCCFCFVSNFVVTKSFAIFKRLGAFCPTFTRIIIGCFFSTRCCACKISLCCYFLIICMRERFLMLVIIRARSRVRAVFVIYPCAIRVAEFIKSSRLARLTFRTLFKSITVVFTIRCYFVNDLPFMSFGFL